MVHRGVDVKLERGFHVFMPQHLAQGLCIKPSLDAPCGKSMAKGMEMMMLQPMSFQKCIKPILKGSWLHRPKSVASKDKGFIRRGLPQL